MKASELTKGELRYTLKQLRLLDNENLTNNDIDMILLRINTKQVCKLTVIPHYHDYFYSFQITLRVFCNVLIICVLKVLNPSRHHIHVTSIEAINR